MDSMQARKIVDRFGIHKLDVEGDLCLEDLLTWVANTSFHRPSDQELLELGEAITTLRYPQGQESGDATV